MRALLIVDVQNDFCEGGSLAVPGGSRVARAISELLDGDPGYHLVAATADYHVSPGSHFSAQPDFAASWPPHCVAGTPGADFHPDLDISRIDAVFRKGEYSAAYSGFEGSGPDGQQLAGWLRAAGITRVDVAGIATDYCVKATAADAAKEGFATRVLLDLTARVSEATTTAALAELRAAAVELTGQPAAD